MALRRQIAAELNFEIKQLTVLETFAEDYIERVG